MKRAVVITILLAGCLPAFAIDNSASAWEFRRKQCDLVGRIAAASRIESLDGKPRTPSPPYDSSNFLYDLTDMVVQDAYESKGTPDDAYRYGFARCLDNIDRLYFDWRAGVRTNPKDFR
jgi:hypothetical protein